MMMQRLPRLIFISDGDAANTQLEGIKQALDGGVAWVQLRCKDFSEVEVEELAFEVQELCTSFGALFSINDHINIAVKILADGVHLGKEDMPLKQAKALCGEGLLLGATANDLDDIVNANNCEADYVGLGPFRFTATKKKLSPILGIEGYQSSIENLKKHSIEMPIYAIGGLTLEDVDSLMDVGVYGFAISSAITKTHSPAKEAEKWVKKLS